MILLATAGALTGILLGMRFTVLVLAPALAFVLAVTVSFAIGNGYSGWFSLLAAISTLAAVQFGYLAGAFARSFVSGQHVSRRAPAGMSLTPIR